MVLTYWFSSRVRFNDPLHDPRLQLSFATPENEPGEVEAGSVSDGTPGDEPERGGSKVPSVVINIDVHQSGGTSSASVRGSFYLVVRVFLLSIELYVAL